MLRYLSVLVGLLALVISSCTGPGAATEPAATDTPQLAARLDPTSPPAPAAATANLATAEPSPDSIDTPRLVLDLDPASLGLAQAAADSAPVDAGLFLSTRTAPASPSWSEADVAAAMAALVEGANAILAQCRLHLNLETAQVIALPAHLLRLQGNQEGSWGGHPPPGTANPELFNYEQNERLTADTRQLFGYGKRHTSANAIAIFTVEHIIYYAEQQLTGAAGLSFPANVYHHPDDYPFRNSVLLVAEVPTDGLPQIDDFTGYGLAHEIGHMLLNSGDHETDPQNLMASLGGVGFTPDQCQRMHRNRSRLYGEAAVPDPGPPSTDSTAAEATPAYTYRIVNTYPHDREAYTQGLVFADGILYEGTGRRGSSSVRKVDLETGEVLQLRELAADYFGEGLAVYGNRVVQLTWQSNIGFVYDRDTFELLQTFAYPTEGWGLTYDGRRLIMSDGTATLHFMDPDTLTEIGRIEVFDKNGPVVRLNELEFIEGEIYANVWQTDRIARIDPQTGQVLGWIDLAGLLDPADLSQPLDVLNGIAHDAQHDRLFVTGKLWPKLFEIKLIPIR